jgi:hypothetical protein
MSDFISLQLSGNFQDFCCMNLIMTANSNIVEVCKGIVKRFFQNKVVHSSLFLQQGYINSRGYFFQYIFWDLNNGNKKELASIGIFPVVSAYAIFFYICPTPLPPSNI